MTTFLKPGDLDTATQANLIVAAPVGDRVGAAIELIDGDVHNVGTFTEGDLVTTAAATDQIIATATIDDVIAGASSVEWDE